MKKRILSLMLAVVMFFGMVPTYTTHAAETEKEVTVSYFNPATETMEEADRVELFCGGEQILSAFIREDVSGDIQWQIETDKNLWVDIQGETNEDLRVSYGMVKSLLRNDTVRMRCVVAEYYSNPFTIVVTDADNRMVRDTFNIERAPIAPDPLPAPQGVPNKQKSAPTEPAPTEAAEPVETQETILAAAEETAANLDEEKPVAPATEPSSAPAPSADSILAAAEDTTLYKVTIEYVYAESSKFSGQRVALPYIAEVARGSSLSESVTSPNCVGYTPDKTKIELELDSVNGNVSYVVKYAPAEVSYTVRHYQQNVNDDEYTWVDTTMAVGYTEALTNDLAAKTYTGFTALAHYREEIAADSSTIIDIYYDRNYYLMSFDLSGGHGVTPIFARYGANVSVGIPIKAGYAFNGWMDGNGTAVTIPKKMPEGNRTYKAKWVAQGKIGYRVSYWIRNPDNSKTLIGSHIEYGSAGETVDGTDNLGTKYGTICGEELSHVHTDECYNCGVPIHTHTIDCFSATSLTTNTPSANDKQAIQNIGGESGYIYVIRGGNGRYWPKLYVDGEYYLVNGIEGGNATSFSSIVEGNAIASKTVSYGTETLTVYKYQAKADCGMIQHAHQSSCPLSCNKHTHTDACYYETRQLRFLEADQNVTIKGDGSSVVNVYYENKEYTLKFYYAASTGTGTNTDYEVVGGSTYYFGGQHIQGESYGKYNSYSTMDMLKRMYSQRTQWGTTAAAPSLNDRGQKRVDDGIYTLGSDTHDGVTYYYISFKARYGENIADKWPCDVLAPVEMAPGESNVNWGQDYAIASAWNGEHHVWYSKNVSNETIKGVYEKLDYKLLYDESFDDSTTVSYLCFWENGANVGWSVPELYRYNIYLSAYSGQDLTGKTTIKRGDKTYYLADSYDTCDDSSPDQQTQVNLTGYNPVTFSTARDGYILSQNNKFEYRQLSGTTDENLLQQDGYFDSRLYKEGYEVNFYYDTRTYKLSFWNYDAYLTNGTGSMVAYHEPLRKYFEGVSGQPGANAIVLTKYPQSLEKDVYRFEGWYSSNGFESETRIDPETAIMPDEAWMLYAHWVPVARRITIYLTESGMNAGTNQGILVLDVPNGSPIPEEQCPDESTLRHPTDSDATFIGWFYRNANGEECSFDFANMAITQDMHIYAKWRSNVMKQVEISYAVENADGTQTEIAETETLMMRLGQTRTFEAKTGNNLFEEYRTGYFPATQSHSITINDDHIASNQPVSYTFVYKKYSTVPYQVQFYLVDKDGQERPAFRKDGSGKAVFVPYEETWSDMYEPYVEEHKQNNKAIVTELYVPDDLAVATWTLPEEYLPNALKIQKIIVPSADNPEGNMAANTIKFVYTNTGTDPDDPNPVYPARYLVQHFVQNATNTTQFDLHRYADESGLTGEVATANPISIPGYIYSRVDTNAKKQNGTTLTPGTGNDPDTMTGTITPDDKLELNFYYTVNSYPYQVMYLEQDTNRVLAQTKTTDANGAKLLGLYGAKVTETAITLEDYDVVGASSKSIYIQMEADDTANVNTIVFYYKLKSAELVLSKEVTLDANQAAQEGIAEIPSWVYDQEFVFTIYRPEGFPKSVYRYIFTDTNNNSEERSVNAGLQTIQVSMKPGESVRFRDFPMGKYTVTETYVPGFKVTVDGYIAQAHTVELKQDGEVGQLDFVNIFPFYTGDLVVKKQVAKLDASDPSATEPYKVTVVLNPDDSAREVDRVITFVNQTGKPVNDANGNSSFTVPKLTGTGDQTQFTVELMVPVDGEVKMKDVPVGSFTATEEVKGTVGYIYDFYTVKYNKAVHENDEVTGTDHVVTGSIHGGHPTAVTFNNTYKKGSLTINKTVKQEYVHDSWAGDTFTFTVTGTTELPDGTYSIVANGAASTVTVTNGKLTFTEQIAIAKTDGATEWTGSLSYENLPAGYYTVTEAAGLGNDVYTATVSADPQTGLVNNTANPTAFNLLNVFKRTTGRLKVSKEIRIVTPGSVIDTEQPFTFVVEPKDSTLTGSYACAVYTTKGTAQTSDDEIIKSDPLIVEDGKLTFTLKHNQYILIQGLPVGNYLVKEEAVEGYDSSFGDVITNAGNYSVDPAVITTNNTTELNCQNAYPVYYSNLIVQKKVVTPTNHSAIDHAPQDDEFAFTVTISNYSDKISLAGGIGAKFYESATDTTPVEKALAVTGDTITFTLRADEWVDLNLPACQYTIAETGLNSNVNSNVLTDHYSTVYTVGGETATAGATYTLVSGEKETVVFTNTYKRHYLDLTITTACADSDQSFIFDVSASGTAQGDIHVSVVLIGNDAQTIKDLPIGDYTVTERTKWSWREADVTSKTAKLLEQSVIVPFDFGVIDNIYWLSDYSYNLSKKGGS